MTWTAKKPPQRTTQDTKSSRTEDKEGGQLMTCRQTEVPEKGREPETKKDTNPMHISED